MGFLDCSLRLSGDETQKRSPCIHGNTPPQSSVCSNGVHESEGGGGDAYGDSDNALLLGYYRRSAGSQLRNPCDDDGGGDGDGGRSDVMSVFGEGAGGLPLHPLDLSHSHSMSVMTSSMDLWSGCVAGRCFRFQGLGEVGVRTGGGGGGFASPPVAGIASQISSDFVRWFGGGRYRNEGGRGGGDS